MTLGPVHYEIEFVLMEFHIVRSRPVQNVAKVFLEMGDIILELLICSETRVSSAKKLTLEYFTHP